MIIGVISVAAVIGMRNHSAASNDLIYPGSRTVVDMTGEGGRALHLQTSDSFSTVEAWYQKTQTRKDDAPHVNERRPQERYDYRDDCC